MEDEELLCFSGVRGCCGVDHLVISGPTRSQCISCAFQDNACDATSLAAYADALLAAGHTILDEAAYAEAMLAAGHSVLDGDAPPALTSEIAVRAVRAYAMQCPPFMDATGGREWDCSLWLTALLSCAAGRATVGVEPPDTVLELGAGAGGLAIRLASDEGFAAALRLYTVTDVEGRVVSLQVHMHRTCTEYTVHVHHLCTACAPPAHRCAPPLVHRLCRSASPRSASARCSARRRSHGAQRSSPSTGW